MKLHFFLTLCVFVILSFAFHFHYRQLQIVERRNCVHKRCNFYLPFVGWSGSIESELKLDAEWVKWMTKVYCDPYSLLKLLFHLTR